MARRIDATLENALRIWAAQERRKLSGADFRGHEDAWEAACLLGKIREERDGASQNRASQRVYESHWGDGLLIHRAMIGMPEAPWACVWLHYLMIGAFFTPAKTKARYAAEYLGRRLSLAEFWNQLELGETWVAARYFAIPNGAGCIDDKVSVISA